MFIFLCFFLASAFYNRDLPKYFIKGADDNSIVQDFFSFHTISDKSDVLINIKKNLKRNIEKESNVNMLKHFADEGNLDASFFYAIIRFFGLFDQSMNDTISFQYLTKGANGGHQQSKEMLSLFYYFGIGCQPNIQKSFEFLDNESIYSKFHLSFHSRFGIHYPHNLTNSFFDIFSLLNEIESLYDIGPMFFLNKMIVPSNQSKNILFKSPEKIALFIESQSSNQCPYLYFFITGQYVEKNLTKVNISEINNSSDPMCSYVLSKYFEAKGDKQKSEEFFQNSLQGNFSLALLDHIKESNFSQRKKYVLLREKDIFPVHRAYMKLDGIGTVRSKKKALYLLHNYSQNLDIFDEMKNLAEKAEAERDYLYAFKIYLHLSFVGNIESIKRAALLSTFLKIKNNEIEEYVNLTAPDFEYKTVYNYHKMMSDIHYESAFAMAIYHHKDIQLSNYYISKAVQSNQKIIFFAKALQCVVFLECFIRFIFFADQTNSEYFSKVLSDSFDTIIISLCFLGLALFFRARVFFTMKMRFFAQH